MHNGETSATFINEVISGLINGQLVVIRVIKVQYQIMNRSSSFSPNIVSVITLLDVSMKWLAANQHLVRDN